MKCLIHSDREAIAVCAECGGAVCEECRVSLEDKSYCKKCVNSVVKKKKSQNRNPVLSAILSFIIGGLGQIYNGQIGKGILILLTSWLIIPWIYGIFDAYIVAGKINKGEIIPASEGCSTAALFVVICFFIIIPIIGVLAAIAVPNFIRARTMAQRSACMVNLKQLDVATQMWLLDTGQLESTKPTWEDLIPRYLKSKPTCYAEGTYTLGNGYSPPACSIGDNDTTYTDDDHILIGQYE